MKNKLKSLKANKKFLITLRGLLYLYVIIALVYFILNGIYESAFVCFLALVLFSIPTVIQRKFNIELPTMLEIVILLLIFSAQILGEIGGYYDQYPYWDTMLHTTSGFIFAAVGFSMVDILNQNSKTKFNLSPLYVALTAFCFSMTVGILWEFFEFSADVIFKTDMQKDTIIHSFASTLLSNKGEAVIVDGIKSVAVNGKDLGVNGYIDVGLYDTMEDLFVNFIGAIVFSVIGAVYTKHRGRKKSIAENFIPKLKEDGNNEK